MASGGRIGTKEQRKGLRSDVSAGAKSINKIVKVKIFDTIVLLIFNGEIHIEIIR